LSIKFEFEATELDENHWVVDFGSLKKLRAKLENYFDHRTLVAKDDPNMDWFVEAQNRGIADLIVMDEIGCEKFAEFAYGLAYEWLREAGYEPRCRVVSAEVREHGANSAIYLGKGN
jgi:6-pyruvoyltetrahydropterin/6-carboxytetrahydropterin synthase